jgi:hypothetical protein
MEAGPVNGGKKKPQPSWLRFFFSAVFERSRKNFQRSLLNYRKPQSRHHVFSFQKVVAAIVGAHPFLGLALTEGKKNPSRPRTLDGWGFSLLAVFWCLGGL